MIIKPWTIPTTCEEMFTVAGSDCPPCASAPNRIAAGITPHGEFRASNATAIPRKPKPPSNASPIAGWVPASTSEAPAIPASAPEAIIAWVPIALGEMPACLATWALAPETRTLNPHVVRVRMNATTTTATGTTTMSQ
jgi:hypothetical protein